MSRKDESPAAYEDVRVIMDKALEIPGLIYELPNHGKAVYFKQRCNKYRNLIRRILQEQSAHIPGHRAQTAYDKLVISQVNADKKPDKKHGHILIFNHVQPVGRLVDPQTGEEIQLAEPEPRDSLLDLGDLDD